jgi:ABC-type transporter Mla subunit MlaD
MKSETSYFKIGLFAAVTLLLLIAGLIAFSADFWMRDVILFETYLDESVQGLSVGSSVLQRGVSIGRVKQITFVSRQYSDVIKHGTPEYDQFNHYVMVVMEIDQKHFPSYKENPEEFKSQLRELIHNGMRVKLTYQGITGMAFLEMDFVDPEKAPLFPPWIPKYIYIPSTPSLITNFTSAVETVFGRIEKIDIEGAVNQLTQTLNRVEKGIEEARLEQLSDSAETLMNDLRVTSEELRQSFARLSDPNRRGGLSEAAAQIAQASIRVERLIDTHESDIEQILKNLKEISQNLRDLTERLREDPAQLLLSSPPAQSEVVQ